MNRLFVLAEDMIRSESYEEARLMLEEKYASLDPKERDAGIIAYSLGIIYRELGDDYRTKLRNKALGKREDFEKNVMKIGALQY